MNPAVLAAAQGAVGIVKKALLILHTDPEQELNPMTIASLTEQVLAKSAGTGLGSTVGALTGAGMADSFHVLQVQYNPTSLSLQANAQETPFQYLQQNVDSGIPTQNVRDPSVVLSVELVFDAVNPMDAFMIDKLTPSVGGAVSAVSGLVKAKRGGYTVQPQTNGLLAALIRDSTRFITFKWADMTFTGEVTEAQAKYTMFSVSGRPIRSSIRLNITQQVSSSADISYWNKAFDTAFGGADNAVTSGGRSFANRYGNLINIGF